jgi:hypothetical protein
MELLSKGEIVFNGLPAAFAAEPDLLERHLDV